MENSDNEKSIDVFNETHNYNKPVIEFNKCKLAVNLIIKLILLFAIGILIVIYIYYFSYLLLLIENSNNKKNIDTYFHNN